MENKESFSLSRRKIHICHVKSEGVCSGKETHIGKTKPNAVTRWNEHENPNKDSEPAKHLFHHPDHVFQWKVLMSASMNNC